MASDDDDDILKSKRFIEVQLPEDYDPSKPYRNGEEYLQWVVHQAQTIPAVVTANLDISKFSKNQTVTLLNEDSEQYKIPLMYLPKAEWQTNKLIEFKEFRTYVQAQLPEKPSPNGSPTAFSVRMDEEYPVLSRIKNISTTQLLKVLRRLVKELRKIEYGKTFNDFLGSWILMALTLIDDPIICDVAFSVRELCKECMRIRYNMYMKNGGQLFAIEANALNMFICIITKFFLQKDLCEA